MQPRRLRLGDVVDDYCSRCRLLSNHAIAAIVDDAIKQTRCSTCDFEHPYKDGKLPARRTKKDGTSALYKQVLDNVSDAVPEDAVRPSPGSRPVLARPEAPRPQPVASPDPPAIEMPVAPTPAPVPALVRPVAPEPPAAPVPMAAAPAPVAATAEPGEPADEGIVHRRLIRATLPRPEGEAREPRPIPTFTVHEAANARTKFRRFRPHGFGQGNANGNASGSGNGNGMPRFGHGHGQGNQASPFGAGRGHGHGKGGSQPNRGGGQHGNRPNQPQRRGNKGR
jgi:hypothetical protein